MREKEKKTIQKKIQNPIMKTMTKMKTKQTVITRKAVRTTNRSIQKTSGVH